MKDKIELMGNFKNIVTFLTIVFLLLVGTCYAFAQENTGENPYLNSEHTYRITVGDNANSHIWVLANQNHVPKDTIVLTDDIVVSIDQATLPGDNEDINIKFLSTYSGFKADTTIYLQYYEYDAGTLRCISAREMPINIKENTFYLLAGTNQANCNDESDSVHAFAEVNDVVDKFPTTVNYTITMHKSAGFKLNHWNFDATFSQQPVASSFGVSATPTSAGITSFTAINDSSFHVVVDTATVSFATSVTVTLTVSFSNNILAVALPELVVTNGKALSGPANPLTVFTDDNIIKYPLALPGDRQQIDTIRALPSTRDIAFGNGETAGSARYPLQYSTHNYKVQMDNPANTYRWRLLDSIGGTIPNAGNVKYVYTPKPIEADSANAQFEFKMAPNTFYFIEFAETDGKGCTSVRRYRIDLGYPFDVDIQDAAHTCAAISDRICAFDSVSATTIDYVVDLVSVGYVSDWHFNFALGVTGNTASDSLFVKAGGISIVNSNGVAGDIVLISGANNYTDTVRVTYNSLTPTTQFTLRVVYFSRYSNEYHVTASMSNISGSFGEQDENLFNVTPATNEIDNTPGTDSDVDGNNQNNTVHYIWKIPETLALEGID